MFETPRLIVRVWHPDQPTRDEDIAALLTPAVLAHLPPSLQTVSSASEWMAQRHAESEVLLVFQKADNTLIGLVILARFEHDVHLGYLLGEQAWGKGYATELVKALTVHLSKAGVRQVIGGVGRDNPASAHVLEKAGFQIGTPSSTDHTIHYIWQAKP